VSLNVMPPAERTTKPPLWTTPKSVDPPDNTVSVPPLLTALNTKALASAVTLPPVLIVRLVAFMGGPGGTLYRMPDMINKPPLLTVVKVFSPISVSIPPLLIVTLLVKPEDKVSDPPSIVTENA